MATAKVVAGSRKPNPNRGSKPGERRRGRHKGMPNKLSGDVKAAHWLVVADGPARAVAP